MNFFYTKCRTSYFRGRNIKESLLTAKIIRSLLKKLKARSNQPSLLIASLSSDISGTNSSKIEFYKYFSQIMPIHPLNQADQKKLITTRLANFSAFKDITEPDINLQNTPVHSASFSVKQVSTASRAQAIDEYLGLPKDPQEYLNQALNV